MKVNSEVRYASHPNDAKHYDTAQLRQNYLMETVFTADEINMVYTMHDRMIAGGAMRAVFESVGIHNILAKSKGSSNPHNLVKATIGALAELRDAYTVAQIRGISLNQVFNG